MEKSKDSTKEDKNNTNTYTMSEWTKIHILLKGNNEPKKRERDHQYMQERNDGNKWLEEQ